jgi:hypothetical protein
MVPPKCKFVRLVGVGVKNFGVAIVNLTLYSPSMARELPSPQRIIATISAVAVDPIIPLI